MTERAHRLFLSEHPSVADNVFLMMSFDSHPVLGAIRVIVETAAAEPGFRVIRADDTDYTGELWANVSVCIENSLLGIAIFDSVSNRQDCDSNVYLELGYMLALSRPCLLLRDKKLGPPPSMLAHRLHVTFDSHDLPGTLAPPILRWLEDRRKLVSAALHNRDDQSPG